MSSSFGLHIQKGRIAKGLRKSELARRLNITPQYLADIENGSIPSEEVIEKLVDALELDEKETFKLADKLPIRVLAKAKIEYYYGGDERGKVEKKQE
jgi:transcriptional regulator with XRE-family HTH domain